MKNITKTIKKNEKQNTVNKYLKQGYTITNEINGGNCITLTKKKQIQTFFVVLSLLLTLLFGIGLILLAITFISYACDSDSVITLIVID